VGYGLAAALTAALLPRFGWRAVFFAGVAPALVTFWIRRYVPEPEIWQRNRDLRKEASTLAGLTALWNGEHRGHLIVATVANAGTMFAWWGLFTWIPAYLSLPSSRGGAGLSIVNTSTWIIVMQVGMWLGYVSFGFISDRIGRKKTYVDYIFTATAIVPVYVR